MSLVLIGNLKVALCVCVFVCVCVCVCVCVSKPSWLWDIFEGWKGRGEASLEISHGTAGRAARGLRKLAVESL